MLRFIKFDNESGLGDKEVCGWEYVRTDKLHKSAMLLKRRENPAQDRMAGNSGEVFWPCAQINPVILLDSSVEFFQKGPNDSFAFLAPFASVRRFPRRSDRRRSGRRQRRGSAGMSLLGGRAYGGWRRGSFRSLPSRWHPAARGRKHVDREAEGSKEVIGLSPTVERRRGQLGPIGLPVGERDNVLGRLTRPIAPGGKLFSLFCGGKPVCLSAFRAGMIIWTL
jgi:hypothetical protein